MRPSASTAVSERRGSNKVPPAGAAARKTRLAPAPLINSFLLLDTHELQVRRVNRLSLQGADSGGGATGMQGRTAGACGDKGEYPRGRGGNRERSTDRELKEDQRVLQRHAMDYRFFQVSQMSRETGESSRELGLRADLDIERPKEMTYGPDNPPGTPKRFPETTPFCRVSNHRGRPIDLRRAQRPKKTSYGLQKDPLKHQGSSFSDQRLPPETSDAQKDHKKATKKGKAKKKKKSEKRKNIREQAKRRGNKRATQITRSTEGLIGRLPRTSRGPIGRIRSPNRRLNAKDRSGEEANALGVGEGGGGWGEGGGRLGDGG